MNASDLTIRYDREATVAAYGNLEHGFAEECGCLFCKNFVIQRKLVYPPSFRVLLEQLGIDPNKEGEVFEYGPVKLRTDVTSMAAGFTSLGKWSHGVSETPRLLSLTSSTSSLPPSAPMLLRLAVARG